jgi:steroid 5-alpha reductase family enzyme
MGANELFAATALTVAGCMLALWLLSVAVRDASIVDVFWGLGFVAIAGLSFLLTAGDGSSRRGLIAAMASLWGLRLAAYLLWRNAGRGEDPRYAAMRRRWGERFWWVSLFSVFALQGVVMWIVSLPVQLGQLAPGAPLGALDALGFALWALGLGFESVGDAQLARFKADPANAGRVMDRGLWRYSRHPNYFGEAVIWWGFYLIALASGAAWTVVSPLLMTFLLLRVSGVSLLEKDIHERRPAYRRYMETTPAFFPWKPRRATAQPHLGEGRS